MKKFFRNLKETLIFRRHNIVVADKDLVDVLAEVNHILPIFCRMTVDCCKVRRNNRKWRIDIRVSDKIWNNIREELLKMDLDDNILTYTKGYIEL